MKNRLFIFGLGFTASALTKQLRGPDWSIAATTRSPEKLARISAAGVEPVLWDGGKFRADALEERTHILVSTPPNESGCPALQATGEMIAQRAKNIAWLAYLSTNGVYGDHGGAWVDETSEVHATSPRSLRRLEAEAGWTKLAARHELPLIIFRLPGIYGPGRSAIETVRAGEARRVFKDGQVFSRMHVDDIAAALAASMKAPGKHPLYNLADDEPAPPQDVVEYACKLLGAPVPPLVSIEDADMSAMAKSFYADNKRVSNERMKSAFSFSLKYPTYREGLDAILRETAT